MVRMVFQEEVRPETIKAMCCLFILRKVNVFVFLALHLILERKKGVLSGSNLSAIFLFFLRNHHTCSFSLTYFFLQPK